MKITLRQLRAAGACTSQVLLFKQHFGDGGDVTLEKCLSVAQLFDWDWAAEHLLSPPAWRAYDKARAPAWRAYDEAMAPAFFHAYNEAKATARRAYDEARATTWRAYDEATATAFFHAYDKARALARRAYDEARATTFFHAAEIEDVQAKS